MLPHEACRPNEYRSLDVREEGMQRQFQKEVLNIACFAPVSCLA